MMKGRTHISCLKSMLAMHFCNHTITVKTYYSHIKETAQVIGSAIQYYSSNAIITTCILKEILPWNFRLNKI